MTTSRSGQELVCVNHFYDARLDNLDAWPDALDAVIASKSRILISVGTGTYQMAPGLVDTSPPVTGADNVVLYAVASRVLIVRPHNNAWKSIFATALNHAVTNTSWQLSPNYNSHWTQNITSIIVAFMAAIIAVIWDHGL